MGHPIALNIFQYLKGIESGHHYVSSTECEYRKGHNPCSVRKGRGAKTNRGLFRPPIVAGHLGHCSPGEIGDAYTFGGPRGSTSRNQTHEALEVAISVCPVALFGICAPLEELLQRGILTVISINADQLAQGGHIRPELRDGLSDLPVVEQPGRFRVVQIFDVGLRRTPEIHRHPYSARPQDTQHADQDLSVIVGIDGGPLLTAQALGPHGAGGALADGPQFAVRKSVFAIHNGSAVGICVRTLVEIVDGTHEY